MKWKCSCSYDGTDFFGWQSQSNQNAVQDVIEKSLHTILKSKIRIHGSSRTDSGVHAEDQHFHFTANWSYNKRNLLVAIQSLLPASIKINSLGPSEENFHARFSAKGKMYRYEISLFNHSPFDARFCWQLHNGKNLNIQKMQEAAKCFLGEHNFKAFAGKVLEQENPTKKIFICGIKTHHDKLIINIEGSGFLYRMARMMVGALVDIGRGKYSKDAIIQMLNSGQKLFPVQAAPARGLFLEKVYF